MSCKNFKSCILQQTAWKASSAESVEYRILTGSVVLWQAAAAGGSLPELLHVSSSDALRLLLVLRDPSTGSGALQELAVALVLDEVCSRKSAFELFPSPSERSTEDLHKFVTLKVALFSTLV